MSLRGIVAVFCGVTAYGVVGGTVARWHAHVWGSAGCPHKAITGAACEGAKADCEERNNLNRAVTLIVFWPIDVPVTLAYLAFTRPAPSPGDTPQ